MTKMPLMLSFIEGICATLLRDLLFLSIACVYCCMYCLHSVLFSYVALHYLANVNRSSVWQMLGVLFFGHIQLIRNVQKYNMFLLNAYGWHSSAICAGLGAQFEPYLNYGDK